MLAEDGFSYTKSEIAEKELSSGSSGSSSDEFSSDMLEQNELRANRTRKTIEHRVNYFKKHMKLLRFEQGKIVDPFRHLLTGGDMTNLKERSFMPSAIAKTKPTEEDRAAPFVPHKVAHKVPSVLSVEDYKTALEKISQIKGADDMEKKMKQYHTLRMKKSLAIDKLTDYLGMLEKKQQQRLLEEHTSHFRRFHYSGPSREGPLFCLREKYRRERKAWRMKYAKKYGLLCRKVRLEKRLMRKANRLLLKERVLNSVKEKTKSKLLILLEMKHEFRKLVERLKLNKEIMEKIKRQEGMNKSLDKEKPIKIKDLKQRRITRGLSRIAPIETGEVQKSVLTTRDETPYSSDIIRLSPLPSVPSQTVTTAFTLPPMKKYQKNLRSAMPGDEDSSKSSASQSVIRCPPIFQDKKLGAAGSSGSSLSNKHMATFNAAAPKKLAANPPKARLAKSTRWKLPLIHDVKYGSAILDSSSAEKQEANVDKVLPSHKDGSESQKKSKFKPPDEFYECKHVQKQKCKEVHLDLIDRFCPLPGRLVKKSTIEYLPRYKYKSTENEVQIDMFVMAFKQILDNELKALADSKKPDSISSLLAVEIKKMAAFILDHLLSLPPEKMCGIMNELLCFVGKDIEHFHEQSDVSTIRNEEDVKRRDFLKTRGKKMRETLKRGYEQYDEKLQINKKEYKANKSIRARMKKLSSLPVKTAKKKSGRTLADKLLLRRSSQFKNPVRVTTKLGGRLMLQGWKPIMFENYVKLGMKLDVSKSGWRKDGMEEYEVLAPFAPVDNLKYLLLLNRLDLTPRRFKFPGYKFEPHVYNMLIYCSDFYRQNILKKGKKKAEKGKLKTIYATKASRDFVTTTLLEGEFRVPHLRHRIFQVPEPPMLKYKVKDKNTPLMFSIRSEIAAYDIDDPKKFRVLLQETETLDLWCFESAVALKGTEDAIRYAKDARRIRRYETRFHRAFDRETQTELVNCIDRSIQISCPTRDTKKTCVYETDIVDATCEPPPVKTKPVRMPGLQPEDISDESDNISVSSEESFPDEVTKILSSAEFATKMKQTIRIMDSLIHSDKQMIFREGLLTNPLDPKAEISYSHEKLFLLVDNRLALSEYVVTSMDWCSVNPNLLAVGYARHPLYPEQDKGLVCIWNIKLITKYERKFEFKSSVTHIQFCVPYPRLFNVALLDGSVIILDLVDKRNPVVTTKLSSVFSEYKPVWQFSWFELEKGNYVPLTCGDNGFIHQLRPDGTFQHSKFLSLGHREGTLKGINKSSSMGLKPRIRGRPGIMCLEKHPTDPVLYFVGTSDGCVHICSIHFRNQHLDAFSAHIGAVKGIEFHPNCENVFLTYGEDFYVRVWLYGTFEPALELMGGNYYVRSAKWSPANPEILVSVSNKFIDVWDVRRKTESPIHRIKNPRDLENTALIFDKAGRNIVVGTISGDVYVYALKNMPFSHHFKGEAIASALEKVLKAKKKFVRDIRKLGYPFGATKEVLVD